MGKAEDEQPLSSTAIDAQGTILTEGNSNGCCLGCNRLQNFVTFRCVFVLVLGVAVLLSAVFWLPFFHFENQKDLDLDYAGQDIVASFVLKKPTSFLHDYMLQLQDDIFDEMSFSNTKVEIISLEPSAGPNATNVVFAVECDKTTQSLIREPFADLITHRTFLHLTSSIFGDPSSFEVLKFRGGITVSPDQKAFLMQSVQILFNFTLNFSIDEILDNFDELTSQLKTGLRLAPYENLYIRLTNLHGSTVDRLTIVQSQVLSAVGINPSKSRFKQLAQTITGSPTKNLGLNNTVFGRVKQVRLSSIVQYSGSNGNGPSPSPSPLSGPHDHHHHHHHHYHHVPSPAPIISPSPSTGSHVPSPAPIISPSPSTGSHGPVARKVSSTSSPAGAPTPAPWKNNPAEPPACHYGSNNRYPWKHQKHYPVAPSVPPMNAPHTAPSQAKQTDPPTPEPSRISAASPLPHVAYARSQPPSRDEFHAGPPDVMPLVSPALPPSSAGVFSSNLGTLLLFILLLLHL